MQHNKSWFFALPPTTAGDRFSRNNIPSEQSYRDLLDSYPNKLEQADTATVHQQGLVKLATDAQVKSRTAMGLTDFQIAVQPHQLPLIMLVATEAATVDTPIVGDGLQATLKEVTAGSVKRYSTKLELEFTNLTTATPAAGDWVPFADIDDSNIIKKATYSDFVTGYWQRVATTISPAIDNDNLNIGQGSLGCGNIYLDETSGGIRFITPQVVTDDDGIEFNVFGGTSTDPTKKGGDLLLYAGTNLFNDSGFAYLAPGQANVGGVQGDVIIGYTKAGVKLGRIGIGGLAHATYEMKVYGGIDIASGGLQNDAVATGVISSIGAWDANKVALGVSAITTNNFLFGTAAKGEVLWFNGTTWTRLAVPGADSVLEFNLGTGDVEWGTSGLGTDVKLAVDSGATADYLGAAKTDGVIRIPTNGGLSWTDQGNYIDMRVDVNDMAIISFAARGSYIPITDPNDSNKTKRINIGSLITESDSGWTFLKDGTQYTATPASTSRLLTSDLTSYLTKGTPIKYKVTGIATYCYAIIETITATYIDIAGDPLSNDLEELYYGTREKVINKTYLIPSATYNSATTESLLETKAFMKEGDRWTNSPSKVVKFEVINYADDSSSNPLVNVRCGAPASVTDYVSTSNTTKGLECSTVLKSTIVDIDHTKNTIDYGENVEIKVDDNSGTGDAQYLTVYVTFVKK